MATNTNRKLPIYLLSTLASAKDDSTNCLIATYILENINEVKAMTIMDLAKNCFVSNSSISRFCKEIGLHDFVELKELIQSSELRYHLLSREESVEERVKEYTNLVTDRLSKLPESLDYEMLDELSEDIIHYQHVYAFGLMKAETVAINFQQDMLMLGKMVTTKINFSQQKEYFKRFDENDLVIIFSNRAAYFDNFHRINLDEKHKPKVYMITSNPDVVNQKIVDRVFTFNTKEYLAALPFGLQLIEGIIAQNVAYKLEKKSAE